MSQIKIYFGNTPLYISDEALPPPTGKRIRSANEPCDALSMVDDHNSDIVLLKTSDVQSAFRDTFSDFQTVKAGGGIIRNKKGEILIIYRRQWWDLPKGHLDKDETIEDCALREVREETGLNELKIIKPYTVSYHVYRLNDKNILKETHWFLMEHLRDEKIKVQEDEGIEAALWVAPENLSKYYPEMFLLIREILEGLS